MMEKNMRTLAAVSVIIAAVLFAAFVLGLRVGSRTAQQPEPIVTHDTIRTIDTVTLPAPPPEVITKTEIKEVKVPVIAATTDTVVDSVLVQLPFEQHFIRLDDVADLWYSGYNAKIDSTIIYKHQQTIVENHYITQPSPANIICLEAGARDASLLYIHRFGSFYAGFSAGSTYEGTATARGVIGFQF